MGLYLHQLGVRLFLALLLLREELQLSLELFDAVLVLGDLVVSLLELKVGLADLVGLFGDQQLELEDFLFVLLEVSLLLPLEFSSRPLIKFCF